jgi:hypothetical protein
MALKRSTSLYSLRIELLDIEPLIWRRVHVPVAVHDNHSSGRIDAGLHRSRGCSHDI